MTPDELEATREARRNSPGWKAARGLGAFAMLIAGVVGTIIAIRWAFTVTL